MKNIISNEQRKYLGLQLIDPNWKEIDVESPNFQDFKVTIFVDDNIVKKCIIDGEKKYKEMQLDEELTKNLDAIIPKNDKKRTSSLDSIINKSAVGMTLSFDAPNISLYNELTHKRFYTNYFEYKSNIQSINDFENWVENWCNSTFEEELFNLNKFASETEPKQVKFKEGDIFKVKLSKDLYGYGKVLLNYNNLLKENTPFWNCFTVPPIVAKLYHILTTSSSVSVKEVESLKSFPSEFILSDNLVSGEYEIIGHSEVDYENESFPIMYGKELLVKNTTFYQCGKYYKKLENTTPLYNNFKFSNVALNIGFDINLMKTCIEQNSNNAYYEFGPFIVNNDLRNPKNSEQLSNIIEQLSKE